MKCPKGAIPQWSLPDSIAIFVVECEHNTYFISSSRDPDVTFEAIRKGGPPATVWTSIHPPLGYNSILIIEWTTSPLREKEITHLYMKMYGIAHVRGGPYVDVELSPKVLAELQDVLGEKAVTNTIHKTKVVSARSSIGTRKSA